MRDTAVTQALLPRIVLGFIAGALSVVIFHQGTSFILSQFHLTNPGQWSLARVPPLGVPRIIDQAFWGGLWGILFVFVMDRFPRMLHPLLAGFLFGFLGPVLVGWLVVAPLRHEPLFGGFVAARMLSSVLVNGAFGIGLAIIVPLLARLDWFRGSRLEWLRRSRFNWFHR